MNTALQALKQMRLKWVESNRENGFDEGINRLLTELYPDNAHFIYELLQNAEDPQATTVHFKLTDSSVEFTHDGKRLFSFKDVESITSIGNSTKRDDATSIGKFGVGFKAVFAYTNTPEIHSGDFHFRIRDLVVPDTLSIKKPRSNQQETRFIFPFDNLKKSPQTAIQEISKGLQALGDNTLLFLSHIRKIEYTLPDGSMGSLQRHDRGNGRIDIHVTTPNKEKTVSHWLHFQKDVEVTDDDGITKTCRIAIAYSLAEDTNKKTQEKNWKIVPLNRGQVSIYFPAEKETSNLRFHIHAPFASTVARDSVRDCRANNKLRDELAKLIVESLSEIKEQGLLTISFLAVLPNETDNLTPFYERIRREITQTFQMHPITPTRNKSYAAAKNLYRGASKISEVIDDEDLSFFTGEKTPLWVANPSQQNQREDRFLDSLNIRRWSWDELSLIFITLQRYQTTSSIYKNTHQPSETELERWLKPKTDKWLMSFYALLDEVICNNKQIKVVENVKIIRVSTKQGDNHVTPSQAYFPSVDGIKAPNNILIVKNSVYANGRSDEQKGLAKLFLEKSGVLPFDTKQVIKLKLDEYQAQPGSVPKKYWEDIKMFCEYWFKDQSKNIEIFKDKTFLRAKSRDGAVSWCKPSDIYIDKPFADTGLRGLFNQDTFELEKYKFELLEDYYSIPNFTEFSIALRVMDRLEICESYATKIQNSTFQNKGRKTDTTVDTDYYINCIQGGWERKDSDYYIGVLPILSNNKLISYAIWRTVCRAGKEQLIARYLPNKSKQHLEKTENSQFIKQLTNCAWIPDQEGNFLKPADLTRETLHPDFTYDDENGWLTRVGFGSNQHSKSIDALKQNLVAIDEGFSSYEQKKQFAELAKRGVDPSSLLAKIPPEFPESAVPNPERRKDRIKEQFENSPSKESVMRERSIQPGVANIVAEAKAYLRSKYTNPDQIMVCQCCQHEMPFKIRDDYYFEATQCVKSLDKHDIRNRLALCPTCSAMYQYARDEDDEIIKAAIVNNHAEENAKSIKIPVTLAGKPHHIRFVQAHWFDLRAILDLV